MTHKIRTITQRGKIDSDMNCHLKIPVAAGGGKKSRPGELPDTGNIETLNANILQLFNLGLLEEMEDDEYTMDILQIFLTQTPVELDKLCKAQVQKNYKEVAVIAHKLKSCTSLLQISRMFRLLELIEQTALRENGNLHEMVTEVISIYRKVESSLLQHLKLMKT